MAAEFAFLTIRELGRQLRAGETSPTELTEYFLDRLDRLGPRYNALVTLTPERARAEARAAEAELRAGRDRGPLHGIPYGAKDLLAAVGYPTTWGAAPFRQQRFDDDAAVIRRLGAAGAILVGKLATVELAGGMGYTRPNAAFTGPGRNAWHRDHWSGGSSSGSGSAVGAGLVPFALGTETYGSIVGPSHFNGVSGVHATFDRVSRQGAMPLTYSMDKIGPLARTADDAGLVLAAISGPDPAAPTATERADTAGGPIHWPPPAERREGLRFATVRDATRNVQPEVAANYAAAVEVLRAIGTVEEIELPAMPFEEVATTIIQAEASAVFDEFIASGGIAGLTSPDCRIRPYAYTLIPARDYLRALRLRRVMVAALNDRFAPYDAVVVPTRPSVAPRLDEEIRRSSAAPVGVPMGAASNVCGFPAISVPNGFGRGNLPTGLEFNGAAYTDERVLAAAAAYQARTDWHTRRPPVPAPGTEDWRTLTG